MIFLEIYISQGSVATHLWCGGIFSNRVVENFMQNVPVKEFWKSVNIFGENMDSDQVGRFSETQYIFSFSLATR